MSSDFTWGGFDHDFGMGDHTHPSVDHDFSSAPNIGHGHGSTTFPVHHYAQPAHLSPTHQIDDAYDPVGDTEHLSFSAGAEVGSALSDFSDHSEHNTLSTSTHHHHHIPSHHHHSTHSASANTFSPEDAFSDDEFFSSQHHLNYDPWESDPLAHHYHDEGLHTHDSHFSKSSPSFSSGPSPAQHSTGGHHNLAGHHDHRTAFYHDNSNNSSHATPGRWNTTPETYAANYSPTNSSYSHSSSLHTLHLPEPDGTVIDLGAPTETSTHGTVPDTVIRTVGDKVISYTDSDGDGTVDTISEMNPQGDIRTYSIREGQWVQSE